MKGLNKALEIVADKMPMYGIKIELEFGYYPIIESTSLGMKFNVKYNQVEKTINAIKFLQENRVGNE